MLLEYQLIILKIDKYKEIIKHLFCFSCMQAKGNEIVDEYSSLLIS